MAPSMAACCRKSAAPWMPFRVAWAVPSSSTAGCQRGSAGSLHRYRCRHPDYQSATGLIAMQQADFRFSTPLRVRWAEVDPQSIVFNGHYLTYCDVGITEYFRALRAATPAAGIVGS